MNEYIFTGVVGLISTALGYVMGQKKNRAEATKIEIENVKEVISVYVDTINDLKSEVKELKEKLIKYQTHIEKLERELESFRKTITPTTQRKRRVE